MASRLRSEVERRSATPHLEVELRLATAALQGRPDIVLAFPDGTCEIIDFKTGIHLEPEPSADERFQLELYGLLVSEVMGLNVVKLRVERPEGPAWEQPFNIAIAESTLAAVMGLVDQFNEQRNDTRELARPGEACVRCRFILDCDPTWKTPNAAVTSVEGEVQRVIVEGGVETIELRTRETSVWIVGCPSAGIVEGNRVRAAHVTQVSEETYRWRQGRSVIATHPRFASWDDR